MENAKEFEGKTLEDAISQACAFFDAPREKLEIDIMQDAKSGIFGLVGVRKAVIRAKLTQFRVSDLLASPSSSRNGRKAQPSAPVPAERDAFHEDDGSAHAEGGQPEFQRSETPRQEKKRRPSRPVRDAGEQEEPRDASERRDPRNRRRDGRSGHERPVTQQGHRPTQRQTQHQDVDIEPGDMDAPYERTAFTPLADLDQEALLAAVQETAEQLIRPIAETVHLDVEVDEGRVAVHVRSDDDLGLLIGREGQTLACLQYLASRIVARRMGTPVRLQFDAGDYRERQDEKLRELALVLADRAKTTGRVCPTRPLSSYQRRIVHMALQDDPAIQTRSAGEGPLKRVVIQRARTEQ